MKRIRIPFFLALIALMLSVGCNKFGQEPLVETGLISNITQTSATCEGIVVSKGSGNVREYGVCWSTTKSPRTSDNKSIANTGDKNFTCNLTGLASGTAYYLAAYATNKAGTAYGEAKLFSTPYDENFTVQDIDGNNYHVIHIGDQTWLAENLKTTKYRDGTVLSNRNEDHQLGSYCWYNNDELTYKKEYGALYSIMISDEICPLGWKLPGGGDYKLLMEFLGGDSVAGGKLKEPGTKHWRSPNIAADNSSGFMALPGGSAYELDNYTKQLIYSGFGERGAWFYPGYHLHFDGFYLEYNSEGAAIGGTGITSYVSVRCIEDMNVIYTLPVVGNAQITSLTETTAKVYSGVTGDGNSPIVSRGICYSKLKDPTINDSKIADTVGGLGTFSCNLSGLSESTTYYLKGFATNSVGTSYGSNVLFATNQGNNNTVNDIDGNNYNVINRGSQVWMVENLKVTKLNDGTPISNINDKDIWTSVSTPAYCWYTNDESNYKKYGALYNWFTVNSAKLCPIGWHVPTDAEWTILTNFLGGDSVAGSKLKEAGFTHWLSPNTGATNSTGFTALPGGYNRGNGTYVTIGNAGAWWSSTSYSSYAQAYLRGMRYDSTVFYRSYYFEGGGWSVRCLRD